MNYKTFITLCPYLLLVIGQTPSMVQCAAIYNSSLLRTMPMSSPTQKAVRTRFAPSPTGYLHVGGLRTALYSYLYAHQQGGTFVLRVEDTDQKRYVEGAVEHLIETLQTMGIHADEGITDAKNLTEKGEYGPYIQSQRTDIYREHAKKLMDSGAAYSCFCTPERLTEMRERQSTAKQAPMYDRACVNLTAAEKEEHAKKNTPYVVRFKVPRGLKLELHDSVRGRVQFNTNTIDDQVLMKSDNFPTYHLASVVDDHLMEITHVIRGEEWLPSTPKHILLYEAFGWKPPQFAHLPLLLNKDKTKLSKRQGDVSVESYLEKGYSVPALLNFVALLGWHPGAGDETEIFSLEELIEKFSLEKVHKAGAVFDLDKLNWFNFQWQKREHTQKLEHLAKQLEPTVTIETDQRGTEHYRFKDPENSRKFMEQRAKLLLELCKNHLPERASQKGPNSPATSSLLLKALITVEEKILKNPSETAEHMNFYFDPKPVTQELLFSDKMKVTPDIAQKALAESIKTITALSPQEYEDQQKLQEKLIELAQTLELKNGQLLWPMRVALTGEQFSPGVFELLWVLGKEESIKRLTSAINQLKKAT